MDNETKPSKIYALIPEAMEKIGAIGKSGYNDHHQYSFRSIEDMYNKIQPVLTELKIFFVPTIVDRKEDFLSESGKNKIRVSLRVRYNICADDGSFISSEVAGEAIDSHDKASNKALTAAFKYMLIQVFCIPVEGADDADKESPKIGASTRSTGNSNYSRGASASSRAPAKPSLVQSEVKTADQIIGGIKPKTVNDVKMDRLAQAAEHAGLGLTVVPFGRYASKKLKDLSVEDLNRIKATIEDMYGSFDSVPENQKRFYQNLRAYIKSRGSAQTAPVSNQNFG